MASRPIRRKTYLVIASLCLLSLLLPAKIDSQVHAAAASSIGKSYWISPNKNGFVIHTSVNFSAMINIADLGYVPDVAFVGIFQNGFVQASLCTGRWKYASHANQWRVMTCKGVVPNDEKTQPMQLEFAVFTRDGSRYYFSKLLNGRLVKSR